MDRNSNNMSVNDIRILKILKEKGRLSRKELGIAYLKHVRERGLTGTVKNDRLAFLIKEGFVTTRIMNRNGLPEPVYELMDNQALQRYIDLI